jgi:hypothetical protein
MSAMHSMTHPQGFPPHLSRLKRILPALAPSPTPCYGVREIDEEGIGTMATIATPVTTRHRLTVADFHRMAEVGIFQEDDRVELIDGEIIDRAPIGSGHAERSWP